MDEPYEPLPDPHPDEVLHPRVEKIELLTSEIVERHRDAKAMLAERTCQPPTAREQLQTETTPRGKTSLKLPHRRARQGGGSASALLSSRGAPRLAL